MTTAREIIWDLIVNGDQLLEEEPMSDVVTFEFYSDTNLGNAFDELQLMSLDILEKEDRKIIVGYEDFQAMGDSIEAIMGLNGGEVIS
jgi:hypothetical protein